MGSDSVFVSSVLGLSETRRLANKAWRRTMLVYFPFTLAFGYFGGQLNEWAGTQHSMICALSMFFVGLALFAGFAVHYTMIFGRLVRRELKRLGIAVLGGRWYEANRVQIEERLRRVKIVPDIQN